MLMTMTAPMVVHLEDSPEDRYLLAQALDETHADAQIVTAENAVQFYRMMRTLRTLPQLVVVDLNLPIIAGHQVLRELKRDPAWGSVPVVVLSSSSREPDIAEAKRHGASAYFVKPQRYEGYLEIAKQVHGLLARRRSTTASPASDGPRGFGGWRLAS